MAGLPVANRVVLASWLDAWGQARALAYKAFGPDLPVPRVGETITAKLNEEGPPADSRGPSCRLWRLLGSFVRGLAKVTAMTSLSGFAGPPSCRSFYFPSTRHLDPFHWSQIATLGNTLGRLPVDHCMSYLPELEGEQMPSQTNFEGLLEFAPDALVGVDQDGVIRFVNRQTELLFGYDRDDLVGQPVEILVPESLRAGHRVERLNYVQHPRNRAVGRHVKLRGRKRDGQQMAPSSR